MGKNRNLNSLEKSLESSLTEYERLGIDDENKVRVLGIITRENKVLTDFEKAKSDENANEERFELEKDHRYWSEQMEEKKFAFEKANKELENEILKTRLSIDQTRIEVEKSNLELAKQKAQFDRTTFFITTGVSLFTVLLSTVMTAVTLYTYKKIVYTNYKLIYMDEGRPTKELENAIKQVNNLIKK